MSFNQDLTDLIQDDTEIEVVEETSESRAETGGMPRFQARNRSFVSRARQLSASMEKMWAQYSPEYVLNLPHGEGHTSVDTSVGPLNLKQLFGRESLVRIEIGSGNGDQIVSAAVTHPDRDFIAFEVYRPGVAKTVLKAVKAGVTNLKIIQFDAAQALPVLIPANSIDEVWTFFPDPWRKARHHKRRLVQLDFALAIARVLRTGGVWRLATDWSDYAFQMRNVIENSPSFSNPYTGMFPHIDDPDEGRGGFSPRWEGRILTNFERRGIEAGREIFDITGQRI